MSAVFVAKSGGKCLKLFGDVCFAAAAAAGIANF